MNRTRVLIAGGGPAGSFAAAALARESVDVLVCEKERFPRYHIGESLLTSAIPLLEFIGARERVERHGFVRKYGGFFRVKQGDPAGYIDFSKVSRYPYSFQVIRSEFDAILLEHARECGASVQEGTLVQSVEFKGERPVAAVCRSADGSAVRVEFDYIIDATGQSGLLSAKHLGNRQAEPAFANVAVGTYFRGARTYRDCVGVEHPGAFSMESLADGSGWTWAIPLHDGTLSVGVVAHREVYKRGRKAVGSLEAYFTQMLRASPDISALISEATRQGELRTWSDYSYSAGEFSGPGYRLAGDAAGFIDPLFSTGVHLAFLGGLSAAATICAEVRNDVPAVTAQAFHERCLRQAYTRLMITVAGFYCQIRNQKDVVLPHVTRENFQLAFDLISPVVSGSVDISSDEVPNDLLSRAMQYTTKAMLEAHDIRTDSRAARLLSRQSADNSVTERFGAIDDVYIRFQNGELGLIRLGAFESALVRTQKRVIKGILSIAS